MGCVTLLPALLTVLLADPGVELADVVVGGETLFTLEKTHTEGPEGRAQVRSVYRDQAGADALVMQADLRDHRPTRVEIEHVQAGLHAEVTIRPGKVSFEVRDRSGTVVKSEEEVLGVVMVGPGLTGYLQADEAWGRLTRGEPVPIQIAAWERRSTYGFELVPSAELSSSERLVVKMRPTAWVVRAFVEEMRYVFERSTRRLLRYEGPVGVKRVGPDGALSDLSAAVVYRPTRP
jgi:hypothetical protein